MYLTKATVNDFQSVEKATLEFPERESGGSITAILGPSSSGKSAFLRALHLWARNSSSVPVRAQSKSKKTKVSVNLLDSVVSVTRGKALSEFTVDKDKYTKSGVTVPEPVKRVQRLYGVEPDLHFAFQFDKPYLISEKGSVVSQTLGELTQANVLRSATKEGNRRLLEAKRLMTTRQEDVLNLRAEVSAKYGDLEEEEKSLKKVENLVSGAFEHSDNISSLSKTVENAENASNRYSEAKKANFSSSDASEYLENAEKSLSSLKSVSSAYFSAFEARESLKNAQKAIPDASEALSTAETCLERCVYLSRSLADAQEALGAYQAAQKAHKAVGVELQDTEAHILSVESQLPRCETCGQIIHE